MSDLIERKSENFIKKLGDYEYILGPDRRMHRVFLSYENALRVAFPHSEECSKPEYLERLTKTVSVAASVGEWGAINSYRDETYTYLRCTECGVSAQYIAK